MTIKKQLFLTQLYSFFMLILALGLIFRLQFTIQELEKNTKYLEQNYMTITIAKETISQCQWNKEKGIFLFIRPE